MNYYIRTTDLMYPFTEGYIKSITPNISYPIPFLPPIEFALVFPTPNPSYSAVTQRLVEIAPELTILGHWEQRWEVLELFNTQEEKDIAISSDQEAKRKAAVPTSVSPRQIRQALTRVGLRAGVEAAVSAGDQDTKDWYEFSTSFERNNTEVQKMGISLGITDLQLDDLWTLASTL